MSTTSGPERRVYESIADLIADRRNPTPLVRLSRLQPAGGMELYAKLEMFNPFGSIKDRTASYLLKGLLDAGKLPEGKRLVEPTSGNTGIALAALANLAGVGCTITVPSAVPKEKLAALRMLGAEVWPTPDDLCPIEHPKDGAIALAKSMVTGERTRDLYVMPNQYENQDNVRAHYETTGPEIWDQTEGRVTHFFAGYGTCGTLTGVGRFLKDQNPAVRIVAVEPQRNHKLPGLKNFKESKQPEILDPSVIDETVSVRDEDAYRVAIEAARKESLLLGPSSGAILWAARETAKKEGGLGVALAPDGAFKYMSFYAEWLEGDGQPQG
ncbi:MAG: cysteine synthase family protein [Deltaproteobacteria bacterium]|nr:cysteine synthase family protein [Deltaproteobacteria bacterium]